MKIVGIRADAAEDDPIVILQEVQGDRLLALWIGEQEANLLSLALEEVEIPRPFTHDTLLKAVAAAGAEITGVCITAEREGIFWAELLLSNGEYVDSRPSDALIIAVKCECDILVESELLERTSIRASMEGESGEITADEVDAFREMLDSLSADDFRSDDDGPLADL